MHKRRRWLAAVPLLAMVTLAAADEEFDKLLHEFQEAQQAWFGKIKDAQKPDGSVDMDKMPPHPKDVFTPRFRKFAEERAGKSEAVPALAWLVSSAGQGGSNDTTNGKWALQRLTEQHAADPAIKSALSQLRYAAWSVGREPLVALCEKVVQENKDKDAVASGKYILACLLYARGPEKVAPDQRAAEVKRATGLFREVAKEGDKALSKRADAFLFEIENLQIGMKAPEIAGPDADGNEIKLSQFRGQVVVIDFWGFW